MSITDIPTEQTTAVTDILLGCLAMVVSLTVYKTGNPRDPKKARIWVCAFGLLAVASFFGAAAHGFKMTERTNFILWQPINLALGLTVALFAAGVLFDLKGASLPRALILALLAAGVFFYAITVLVPGTFIMFIFYEAIAMLFAFISYLVLSFRKKHKAHWLMAAGILLSIIAACIQAVNSVRFTLVWEFDHNGIFHIIQIVGLIFLLSGLRSGFLSLPSSKKGI